MTAGWALTLIGTGVCLLGVLVVWNSWSIQSLQRRLEWVEDARFDEPLPKRSLTGPTLPVELPVESSAPGRHSGPRPKVDPVAP